MIVYSKYLLSGIPGVVQRVRVGEEHVDLELEASEWRRQPSSVQRRGERRAVEGHEHLGTTRHDCGQPVTTAHLGQHGVVGAGAVVEDELVAVPRALAPRQQRAEGQSAGAVQRRRHEAS